MGLSKKQRKQVYDKSGGKCWYCGCDLPERGWHADHIQPVIRELKIVPDTSNSIYSHKMVATGKLGRAQNDTIDNMVPACAPCNLFKASYDVEFFRTEIEAQIERVRKASSGFRIAERCGLIETKPQRVVFWYETQDTTPAQ
jgi:5-methylcytosine-specific restriction endonuclease McrA